MPLEGDYKPGSWPRARDQAELYERTSGAEGDLHDGRPIVVLTSIGVKSGSLRKTALMRIEHEGQYAIVASMGGSPDHPSWFYNVLAQPHVELQDGAIKQDFVARLVKGDIRAEWWRRAVEAYAPYAEYQEKTNRVIPVFVLSAINGAAAQLTSGIRASQLRNVEETTSNSEPMSQASWAAMWYAATWRGRPSRATSL